jgi:hypothetical protein
VQFRLLGEAIQKAQEALEESGARIQSSIEFEGKTYRKDLVRLDEGLERTQRAIADLSESSKFGMQIATRDIKHALSTTITSVTTSQAVFLQTMAQDLENKITNSFTSALQQYGRTLQHRNGRALVEEDGEKQLVVDEKQYQPPKASTTLAIRNSTQPTQVFFRECLAQM